MRCNARRPRVVEQNQFDTVSVASVTRVVETLPRAHPRELRVLLSSLSCKAAGHEMNRQTGGTRVETIIWYFTSTPGNTVSCR